VKKIILILILLCTFGINDKWFEGVNLLVYDYGEDRDSRFFFPNTIKIYNSCSNKDVLIHELAHYDNYRMGGEQGHNEFFLLSYYRIKGEV